MNDKHTHRRIVHFIILLAVCAGLIAVSHVVGTIVAVAALVAYGVAELVLHLVHDVEKHHRDAKAQRPSL